MSYQRERDQFIARMTTEGMPLDVILRILRHASTIQRLAEAECSIENHDARHWPAGNDSACGMGADYWPAARKARTKPDVTCFGCRSAFAERHIAKACTLLSGFRVHFQGDPRGYCVRIAVPSRPTDADDTQSLAIGVPVRS